VLGHMVESADLKSETGAEHMSDEAHRSMRDELKVFQCCAA
jgi:hypothetical protein